ncbi:MAG: hypothetical protein ACJAXT_001323, partial [Paracoccaceae bacterium]
MKHDIIDVRLRPPLFLVFGRLIDFPTLGIKQLSPP